MAAAVLEVAAAAEVRRRPGARAARADGGAGRGRGRSARRSGHDYAVISLSDRLKPWEVIAERLAAAAARRPGDRDLQPGARRPAPGRSPRARDLLLEHRGPDTPVVLGRDVGGPGERITVTTLADLDPEQVDMRCLLIVGSSTTRVVDARRRRRWCSRPATTAADSARAGYVRRRARERRRYPSGRHVAPGRPPPARPSPAGSGPTHHQHGDALLPGRGQLRPTSAAPPLSLVTSTSMRVLAQQRPLAVDGERPAVEQHLHPARHRAGAAGRRERTRNHAGPRRRTPRGSLPAGGEEHPLAQRRQRAAAAAASRHAPPVGSGAGHPGRRSTQQRHARPRGRGHRVRGHRRRERVRGVDDRVDRSCAQPAPARRPRRSRRSAPRPRAARGRAPARPATTITSDAGGDERRRPARGPRWCRRGSGPAGQPAQLRHRASE